MPAAEVTLAEMLVHGRGGAKGHPAALTLFGKAARRGRVGAMFAVGAMNGEGHPVPTDRKEAQHWFGLTAGRAG